MVNHTDINMLFPNIFMMKFLEPIECAIHTSVTLMGAQRLHYTQSSLPLKLLLCCFQLINYTFAWLKNLCMKSEPFWTLFYAPCILPVNVYIIFRQGCLGWLTTPLLFILEFPRQCRPKGKMFPFFSLFDIQNHF